MEDLRKKLFKKVKPKSMQDNKITGPMLVELANSYVQSINSGSTPHIESAWINVLSS